MGGTITQKGATMTPEELTNIGDLFASMVSKRRTALLQFKLAVGRILAAKYKETDRGIMSAVAKIGVYIKRRFHEEYGEKWWRGCYYLATRLTDAERTMIFKRDVSANDVQRIVDSAPDRREKAIARIRKGERPFARKAKKPQIADSRSDGQVVVLPIPYDRESAVAALAAYLAQIKRGCVMQGAQDRLRAEVDAWICEARQNAGV